MEVLKLRYRKIDNTPFRLEFYSDNIHNLRFAYRELEGNLKHDRVTFPVQLNVVEWFEENLSEVEIAQCVVGWVSSVKNILASTGRLRSKINERIELPISYTQKLYPYQTIGASWLHKVRRGILADMPGLGKTLQGIAAADLAGAKKVLVLTVNHTVQKQWVKTIEDWSTGRAILVEGTKKQRLSLCGEEARWYVLPVSVLSERQSKLKNKNLTYKKFLTQKFDAIIIDEAHLLQGRNSTRGQKAANLKSDYLFLLTGTPIWNKIESIWNLLHIIDGTRWCSYWKWIFKYFSVYDTAFGRQVGKLKKNQEQALQNEINSVLLRRELHEVLDDIPKATMTSIPLDMDSGLRTRYKQLVKKLRNYEDVTVCGKKVEVWNHLAALPTLRRLLNHPAEDNRSFIDDKFNTIIDCTNNLVEQNKQVLIFTWHTDYADRLAAHIPGARSVHGKKPPVERTETVEKFKLGKIRVVVATMLSLSTGVDLPNVDVLMFTECDWTPAIIDQAWRRIYRVNSKEDKQIVFFFYKKTVEELIYNSFNRKQALSDKMLANQIFEQEL